MKHCLHCKWQRNQMDCKKQYSFFLLQGKWLQLLHLNCQEKTLLCFLSLALPSPPSLPASLPPSLLFLSVSVHHIANTTSPQYISLSDFIDLWPVMSQFASSTFIYAIPRTYTFWSKKRILSSVPMEHTLQVPSVQKKQSPNIWDCDKV